MSMILIAILSLIFVSGAAISAWIIQSYRKKANRFLEYLSRHVWNSISLQKLIGSPIPLLPPTGWAADSDLLTELSRLVAFNKPKLVIELGSGLSTVVMAATLRSNGQGRLISIDHDTEYAHKTRQSLGLAGLTTLAEVRTTPLKEQRQLGPSSIWYDLSDNSLPESVDLVFIDGPPAMLGTNIRAPALDYFWPRLSTNGLLVFDDAARREENTFIEQWLINHPDASLHRPVTLKGCAIISKAPA